MSKARVMAHRRVQALHLGQAAVGAMLVMLAASVPGRTQDLPAVPQDVPASGLVHLRDVDASILQDIRYAGANNFTGRPVPGYAAAECLLLRDVAEALAQVQAELRKSRLSLQVYDCYRPRRAVRAFQAWVQEPESDPLLKRFYPSIDKGQLMSLGYIASVSRHSRGDTVDLTLVALPSKPVPPFRRDAAYGTCAGPAGARPPDKSLDMGTSFDCFDPLSHTAAPGLAAEHNQRRTLLVSAMAKQGFRNYEKEWWHFTHESPLRDTRSFDVPVTRRQH